MCFIPCPISGVNNCVWHSPLSAILVPISTPQLELCKVMKSTRCALEPHTPSKGHAPKSQASVAFTVSKQTSQVIPTFLRKQNWTKKERVLYNLGSICFSSLGFNVLSVEWGNNVRLHWSVVNIKKITQWKTFQMTEHYPQCKEDCYCCITVNWYYSFISAQIDCFRS